MRVTAGIAKGHGLLSPKGYNTRPTSDKIKQSLFNMISGDLSGASFLDLFAGTGQIGIEALSRGAFDCTFVENKPEAMECIKKNLINTKLADKAYTYFEKVENALKKIADAGKLYNIIFMDPPYENAEQMDCLTALIKKLAILRDDGYIIGEHGADIKAQGFENIKLFKQKCYGKTTVISFWTPL